MMAQRIFLIGMMGAGKTSGGKKLALLMNWEFCDLDRLIELQCDLSVSEIFATHGEAHFRKLETQALNQVCLRSNLVIATGGGTPCHGHNLQTMLQHGFTVYLNLPLSLLEERLARNHSKRPLLAHKGENLSATIANLHHQRQQYYTQAHQQLFIGNHPAEYIAKQIATLARDFYGNQPLSNPFDLE